MTRKPLDEIDRKILRELVANARITSSQLAERVGLSSSPCWQRVRRLEEDGYIDGYVAILNQEALGLGETVIVEVTLERHDDEALQRFGAAMLALPEVIEAYLTTGEYDYIIKVAVSGTSAYEEFLSKKLYKIPGVRHSRSCFTLRCVKNKASFMPSSLG
ncbi:Lrp/AsnC family transcriptional regulator [Corticibacterium sp. UT-5YL-CI-8]|nr:Lrp/AsnC family transcriptional regulator [Tianweitania sp. UT-5YL-CI-8]